MTKYREGPKICGRCTGCRHYKRERFRCQGDVGAEGYCTSFPEPRYIGVYDYSSITPEWCPKLTRVQQEALFQTDSEQCPKCHAPAGEYTPGCCRATPYARPHKEQ